MSAVEAIERKLSDILGLRPRLGAAARLERELRSLRQEHGVEAHEVAERLQGQPWLVRRLAGAITVEETFFLRHSEHFEVLTSHLRRVHERLGTGERITVWSAGCASGEEPYSMGLAIHRALGPDVLRRTQIIANDVNRAALAQARDGVYGPWSFRGTAPGLKAQYFRPHGLHQYRVLPQLRAAVVFNHLSLEQQLSELRPALLDVVFFRNVAIYLTEAALSSFYSGLLRVLKSDGLLLLGPADPPPSPEQFKRIRCAEVPVYCKRESESSRAAAPMPSQVLERSPSWRAPKTSNARSGFPTHQEPSDAIPKEQKAAAVVRSLADRGQTPEALRMLDELGTELHSSSELLALRGRIQLALGNPEGSLRDLRAALSLEPSNSVLRFHCALALEALDERAACCLELKELLLRLQGLTEADAIIDGELTITVSSLRQAAHELLRRVE